MTCIQYSAGEPALKVQKLGLPPSCAHVTDDSYGSPANTGVTPQSSPARLARGRVREGPSVQARRPCQQATTARWGEDKAESVARDAFCWRAHVSRRRPRHRRRTPSRSIRLLTSHIHLHAGLHDNALLGGRLEAAPAPLRKPAVTGASESRNRRGLRGISVQDAGHDLTDALERP
jgi:hypothetical protein